MPRQQRTSFVNSDVYGSDVQALNDIIKIQQQRVKADRATQLFNEGMESRELSRSISEYDFAKKQANDLKAKEDAESYNLNFQGNMDALTSLSANDPEFDTKMSNILGNMSDVGLADPKFQYISKWKLNERTTSLTQETKAKARLEAQADSAGLLPFQQDDVMNSPNSAVAQSKLLTHQISNGKEIISGLNNIGDFGDARSEMYTSMLDDNKDNPFIVSSLLHSLQGISKNFTQRHDDMLKSNKDDAANERDFNSRKAKNLMSFDETNLKLAADKVKQLNSSVKDQFKKGDGFPKEGDDNWNSYQEAKSTLKVARTQLTKLRKLASDSRSNYESINYSSGDKGRASARTKDKDPTDMVKSLTGQ